MLTETLDLIKDRGGGMERIFESCKAEGQEAMSKEILLLITLRHLKGRDRLKILTSSPSLIIPFIYRSARNLIGLQ
jgi:hypothetical protein